MDDISFKYPKKIFQGILVALLAITVMWGLITGSPEKAVNLWFKGVDIVMQPLINRAEKRIDGVMERAMESTALNEESESVE